MMTFSVGSDGGGCLLPVFVLLLLVLRTVVTPVTNNKIDQNTVLVLFAKKGSKRSLILLYPTVGPLYFTSTWTRIFCPNGNGWKIHHSSHVGVKYVLWHVFDEVANQCFGEIFAKI